MNTKRALQRSAKPAGIISLAVGLVRGLLGSMIGDYIIRMLAKYGIGPDAPIAWLLSWVFASPLNVIISTFLLVLILSVAIEYYQNSKTKEVSPDYATSSFQARDINVAEKAKFAARDLIDKSTTYNIGVDAQKIPENTKLKINIIPNNNKWISATISNPLDQSIECYCVLKLVELNGINNEEIRSYITEHSPRISWSGGDTKGEGEGVKVLDTEGTLNIVTPTHNGLGFEMAKGCQVLGYEKSNGIGEYKVTLDLQYSLVRSNHIYTQRFDVKFECIRYKAIRHTKNGFGPDTVYCGFGPRAQIFIGESNMDTDYLYVKIAR